MAWLPRDRLRANLYNPNRVAPPELDLLRLSLLADGWTQPLVARPDGDGLEIVDGFHRWTLAAEPEVAALTGGLVPVVLLARGPADQMASTIRHNRARGLHGVLRMAEIVRALLEAHGWSGEAVARALGMEDEEVRRLADRAGLPARHADRELGRGWIPR